MANFIFASHKERKAEDIYLALREKQIFVRYFKQPRLDNYLRITIGTDEEMEKLYDFLEKFL
jgi:histidinol-phosphate aminotransferase